MSHEYRVAIAIPLSGTDRVQSALKAKIGPLIDDLEQKIVALGMEATITDTTVRLKVKGEPDAKPDAKPDAQLAHDALKDRTPAPLVPPSGLTGAEGAHHAKAQRAAE